MEGLELQLNTYFGPVPQHFRDLGMSAKSFLGWRPAVSHSRPLDQNSATLDSKRKVSILSPRKPKTNPGTLMRTYAKQFLLPILALTLSAPFNRLHAQSSTGKVDSKNNSGIVARINDVNIPKRKLEEAVKAASTQLERSGRNIPAEQMGAFRNSVLDELIGMELLSQEAKSRKLTPTDKEIKKLPR